MELSQIIESAGYDYLRIILDGVLLVGVLDCADIDTVTERLESYLNTTIITIQHIDTSIVLCTTHSTLVLSPIQFI